MKRAAAILLALLCAGCQSKTAFGDCVGAGDDENPALHYKVSTRNLVLGIIFIETIVVPIVVASDEFKCPIGPKARP